MNENVYVSKVVTEIDHFTLKCVILLSKEYQQCSVVRVHAFSISVYY